MTSLGKSRRCNHTNGRRKRSSKECLNYVKRRSNRLCVALIQKEERKDKVRDKKRFSPGKMLFRKKLDITCLSVI